MNTNPHAETVRLFHPDSKIYLDYNLPILQEILLTVRDETGSLAATLLREYEHVLIEAKRLDEDRAIARQEELIREKIEGDVE